MIAKRLLKWFWRWTKRIFLFLFFLQLFCLILFRWVNPPITITQLGSWIGGDGLKRDYVRSHQVSYYAKLAVIAEEDQLFPDHKGFDWKSIKKAMEYNNKKPGRIRGGSTISQQVAKNVFLWQDRSWFRKALETYFTFMIELTWGKKRILEVYLNVIETGKGIYGIETASQTYFSKPASALSATESAMIASCLRNPKRFTVKPLSPAVAIRSKWVLAQMKNLEGDPDIQRIVGNKVADQKEPDKK